jgi:uncharacterized protein
MSVTIDQRNRFEQLITDLGAMGRVAVAFSGGVDSAFLLYAAQQALGEAVVAVTFATPYSPKTELAEAFELASSLGVDHRIVSMPIPASIRNNPSDRCYLCKRILLGELRRITVEEGIEHILDGSNLDDMDDYRPGFRAVKELEVRSPLLDAELTKQDIRDLSMEHDLSTWNKPSGACLLTRLPHGTAVEEAELERIDKGETLLKSFGFTEVRLRSHGTLARIELPSRSIASCMNSVFRGRIDHGLRELGYQHVAVDLAGYRTGSLNEPGSKSGSQGE